MPPPFLFNDMRGAAGVCTLYRYQGASPAQVGDTFGSQWTGVVAQAVINNGAIQYKGNLYALAQDGVYVKDDPTTNSGAWTQAIAFTGSSVVKPRTSGLHVVYISDAPVLVVVFGGTVDNVWRWAKFDGTTWTQAAGDVAVSSLGEMHAVAVYRNVIHMIGSAGAGSVAMTYDPASDSFATVSEPFGTSQYAHCMAVFNDRLFGVHNVSNVCRLVEYSGGAWVDVPGGVGLSVDTGNYLGKWGIWTDGTYLYAMVPSASTDGWRVLQWDASLGPPTNLTATVLPSSLRSATDGGTYGGGTIQNASVFACGDQDTDPAVGDVWLFVAPHYTSGTPYSLWKWNGPAALIGNAGVANDSGGDTDHAIPIGLLQAGERIWTAGELDIVITGKQAVVGGERISFIVYGDAGPSDKTVRFYFNTEGEPAIAQCVLIGSVTGGSATRSGNDVINVNADGTTVYTAIWDIGSNGVSSGDRAQIKPLVTV